MHETEHVVALSQSLKQTAFTVNLCVRFIDRDPSSLFVFSFSNSMDTMTLGI